MAQIGTPAAGGRGGASRRLSSCSNEFARNALASASLACRLLYPLAMTYRQRPFPTRSLQLACAVLCIAAMACGGNSRPPTNNDGGDRDGADSDASLLCNGIPPRELEDECSGPTDCDEHEACIESRGQRVCASHERVPGTAGGFGDPESDGYCEEDANCGAAGEAFCVTRSDVDEGYVGACVVDDCDADADCSGNEDFPFGICVPAGRRYADPLGETTESDGLPLPLKRSECTVGECLRDADCGACGTCTPVWPTWDAGGPTQMVPVFRCFYPD